MEDDHYHHPHQHQQQHATCLIPNPNAPPPPPPPPPPHHHHIPPLFSILDQDLVTIPHFPLYHHDSGTDNPPSPLLYHSFAHLHHHGNGVKEEPEILPNPASKAEMDTDTNSLKSEEVDHTSSPPAPAPPPPLPPLHSTSKHGDGKGRNGNARLKSKSPSSSGSAAKQKKAMAHKRMICVPASTVHDNSSKYATVECLHSDSWAWRKYGQKPIKGSPFPRAYYRCSSSKGCTARKQVERSKLDPAMLVITYSSEHNHALPAPRGSANKYVKKQQLQGSMSSSNNIDGNVDPSSQAAVVAATAGGDDGLASTISVKSPETNSGSTLHNNNEDQDLAAGSPNSSSYMPSPAAEPSSAASPQLSHAQHDHAPLPPPPRAGSMAEPASCYDLLLPSHHRAASLVEPTSCYDLLHRERNDDEYNAILEDFFAASKSSISHHHPDHPDSATAASASSSSSSSMLDHFALNADPFNLLHYTSGLDYFFES